MESQSMKRFWRRRTFNRLLAFALALVMVFGSVPDHMMSVRAESGTELSGGKTVSGNAGDVQNSEEGGEGSGISMLAEGETTTETVVGITSVGTKKITWTGSSPVQVNITDLFTVSGVSLSGLVENEDYSVTFDATNMPSVSGYPKYIAGWTRIQLNPTAAGSVEVTLDIFTNASKGIKGATSTATIAIEKGELSEDVKSEYFLDFGGATTAEYGNSITADKIKVIDNTGNQCTGNVTYTYYKVVDGVNTKIDTFPKNIGTYVVEAQINADLWNSFTISKTLEIIPKKVYIDVNATTHQYGLVSAGGVAENIVYTVEGANVATDGTITIDSTSKSGENSYGIMEGDTLKLSCSSLVTNASTPGQYWIYVTDNSDNYDVIVNRNATTGLGFVTITKRDVTAEWPENANYALEHTNKEQTITPVLENYLAADKGKVSLVVTGNTATDLGTYEAAVTGLTGDSAAYYNLTNASEASPLKQAWSIVYATDSAKGEATISGTSAALEGDTTKWYSGTVTLNALSGYEITLDSTYKTGWATSLDVTNKLADGAATTLTYYIRQAATGIIVGQYDVTINYDKTAPTGSVTFKNVTTDTKVTPSTVAKFFINKATEVTYTSADTASNISKVEYAVLGLGATPGTDTTWKTATNGKFTITPANSVTGAVLASNADCGLGEYVIYVKITDKAGNETVISTDTIVVFDGMKVDNLADKDYAAEYKKAAGEDVKVVLKPNSQNPFDAADYIASVVTSNTDGSITVTLDPDDYSFDAAGNLTLTKAAFNYVTSVGIGDNYIVTVTLKPFGHAWCASYGGSAEANDTLDAVSFKVRAIKTDASITLTAADSVVYDGQAYDNYSVTLGQEGGTKAYYYATYAEGTADTAYVWNSGLPTNVGKYRIKAAIEFGQSDLYNNAADYATVEITKADATVTVTVADKPYDKTAIATIKDGGIKVETATGKSLTFSGLVATFDDVNAGTGKTVSVNTDNVVLTGDDINNYKVTYVAEKANITKRNITLTVADIALKYGDDVATKVSAIKSEDVAIDTLVSGDSLSFSFTTAAVAGSNVGTYPISLASDWSDTNYNVTAVDGDVVISALPIVVEWRDDTNYYYTSGTYFMRATVSNALEKDKDSIELSYDGVSGEYRIGTYTTIISGVNNTNYTIEGCDNHTKTWSIKQWEPAADEWLNATYGWYNFSDSANVLINADADYAIRVYTTAGTPGNAAWVDTFSIAKGDYADGTHTFYYQMKTKSGGYLTTEKSFTVSIDETAPTGTITVGEGNTAKSFTARLVNVITSLFYKEQVVVTIGASDVTSGMATEGIYYAALTSPLAENATIADGVWEKYTGQKTINSNSKVYVYAKLVDKAGNSAVINTDGIVVYKESAYAGTAAKEAYTKYSGANLAVAFTYNENTVKSVTIVDTNGNVVKTLATTDYTANGSSIVINGSALDTLPTTVGADSSEYKIVVAVNPLGVEMPASYTGVAPTDVVVPLTVSKGVPTITVNAFTKTYDGEAVKVDATTGITYEVKKGDATAAVTPTYYAYTADGVGAALDYVPVNAGNYYVKLTIAETAEYVSATSDAALITINKKDVNGTITIKDKIYDGTTVAFVDSVSIATGVTADVFSYNTSSTAAFSFADKNVAENIAVSLNENSSYADLVTGADINNYVVTYTVSAADITKAPLTLTIGDMTAVYGDTIDLSTTAGTLIVTGSGMVNGELVKDVVTVSYAPTEKMIAGTHNIALDKFAVTSANYAVTLSADAKLEITKRPITLKWQATNEKFTNAFDLAADKNTLTYNAYEYVIGIAGYENVVGDDVVTAEVTSTATVPGSYTATAGQLTNTNYMYKDATTNTFAWNIKYLDEVDENYKKVSVTSTDWYSGDVSFAPAYATGSTISTNGANDTTATWAEKLTITAEGKTTGKYAIKNSEGYITSLMDYTALIDKTAPTADIKVDFDTDKSKTFFAELLNTITFGMFSVADVTVTVTTSDANGTLDVSGVANTYYQITNSATYVDETAKWTVYEADKAIKLTEDSKNVVFVKVVDNAGNYDVYNTDGVVVYTNSTATVPTVEASTTVPNAFQGYLVQRADAADISLAINLNGNTLAGVTCDGTVLTKDTDYTFENGALTLKKAFVASLRADSPSTTEDEGMHAISLSFNPQGEKFVEGTSLGAKPTTIDFSIKMIKKAGKVVLYSDYATKNEYNGNFVALPLIEETLSSGVPTYQFKEKSATAYTNSRPKDAGEYTVKVTVPEDDYYMEAFAEMDFTIAPKALTVVVPVADREYDGTTTATVDGNMSVATGIAGESFTVAGTVAAEFADKNVGTGKSVTITGTDDVEITPANDNTKKANYTFTYAADAAAITAKPVTVYVNPVTKTYGDVNPAFTLSEDADGLVAGETVSDIGNITLKTTADQYTGIGSYDVTFDADAFATVQSNYIVTVNGDNALTINARPVKLAWPTAEELKLVYNAKPQAVTAKVTETIGNDVVQLTYKNNEFTATGSYTAEVIGVSPANYTIEGVNNLTAAWSISYLTVAEDAVAKDENGQAVTAWYNKEVTICPPAGYYIATGNTNADAGWMESIAYDKESMAATGTTYTYYLKSMADGSITDAKTLTVKIDKTAPSGQIVIRERNFFESVINKITFNMFYKNDAVVKITANESLSGVATIEYMLAASYEEYMGKKDIASNWTVVNGLSEVSFPAESVKAAVFARITDGAGNSVELNTDGLVVYKDSRVEDTTATYTRLSNEDVVIQATLNGNTVESILIGRETLASDMDYEVDETTNKITLKSNYLGQLRAGEHTIVINYNPLGSKYLPGVSNGDAPLPSTVNLTVEKAVLTDADVTVQDMSKTYDGMVVWANVTSSSMGKVNVEYKAADAEDSEYSFEAPRNVGEYVARITIMEDENYLEYTTTESFEITKADLIVQVEHMEYMYGDMVPMIGANVESCFDRYEDLQLTLEVDAEASDYSENRLNAGTYDVIGTCANENYNAIFENAEDAVIVYPRYAEIMWSGDGFDYTAKNHTVEATIMNLCGSDVCELTIINNTKSAVGNYVAEITALSNSNYVLPESATWDWMIDFVYNDVEATLTGGEVVNDWFTSDAAVVAPEGYKISTQYASADAALWSDKLTVSAEGFNEVVYYLQNEADGTITCDKWIGVMIDKTAPTGTINVRDNAFKSFLNTITFGMFFKNTVDVSIDAEDEASGVATVEYQRVDEGQTLKDDGWKRGYDFEISKNVATVIYARITDCAGHVTVINSDGVVVYTDAEANTTDTNYAKRSGMNVVAEVELNGNTVDAIVNGDDTLVKDVDYTVNEATGEITFKNSYLETLSVGSYTFVISYNPLGMTYVEAESNDAPATTQVVLTVSKNNLLTPEEMIQVADMSKTYDGVAVVPEVTTISEGAVSVYYKTAGALSYTTVAPTLAGQYEALVVVAEDENYVEYELTTTFEIEARDITVTVDKATVAYGDAVPTFTAKADESMLATGDTYADLEISLAAKGLTYTGTYVNAGKYDVIGAAGNTNYNVSFRGEAEAFVVAARPVIIEWTDADLTYTAKEQSVVPTIKNLVGQDTCGMTVSNDKKNAVGEYIAEVTALANGNYTLAGATGSKLSWSISYSDVAAEATLVGTTTVDGWYTSDVDVTAPEGYKLSTQCASAEEGWTDKITVSAEGKTTVEYYLQSEADGTITAAKSVDVNIDKTAPTGSVSVKENVFKQLLNTISFGLFYKNTVDVEIDAEDAISGVAKVEYQRVDYGKAVNDSNWKNGSEFEIARNSASVVYARITDKAGNVEIISSNGIVVYSDAAQITADITYAKLSEKDVTASVRLNDNTVKAIVNGEKALVADTDYTVDANGNITFKASYLETLAAGSYTFTISYNPFGLTYVEAEGNDAPADTTLVLAVTKAESLVESLVDADDFAKVYDGEAVAEPTVEANEQSQKLTYEYKVKGAADSTYATAAPTEAGDYTVRVTAAENDYYVAKTITIDFTIAKKAVTVKADNQTVEEDGAIVEGKYAVSAGALVSGHSIASAKLTADTSVITENGKIEISNVVINDANAKDVTANYEITCEAGSLIVTRNRSFDAVTITVELAKYGYEIGEQVSNEDITVKVTYKKDGYVEYINNFVTNAVVLDMNTAGVKTLVVSYTFDGVQCSEEFVIDVTADQGDVGFEVLASGNVPTTSLSSSEETLKNDVLTEEEKQQVADGADYDIYLTVSDDVKDADKEAVKAAVPSLAIGSYMNISLYKKVGLGQVLGVHEVDNKLMITVKIPQNLILNSSTLARDYYVVRLHEGASVILTTYVNRAAGTLTFETDRFSTYAIAYNDRYVGTPETGKDDVSEGSGEGTTDSNESTGSTGSTTGGSTSTGSTSGGHKSPKTGDEAVPFVGMLSIITLLGAMLIYKKSYVEKN